MKRFCGICRSTEHFTGEHYKQKTVTIEHPVSILNHPEAIVTVTGKASDPVIWMNTGGFVDPPVKPRGRKRVYKDRAAKQRAYRERQRER